MDITKKEHNSTFTTDVSWFKKSFEKLFLLHYILFLPKINRQQQLDMNRFREFHELPNKYYYIDMSVLPKNRQLVFSIRNNIQDTSEIFSIFSQVKISLTSFLCFSFVFRLFFLFLKHSYLCNKRKLHVSLNI